MSETRTLGRSFAPVLFFLGLGACIASADDESAAIDGGSNKVADAGARDSSHSNPLAEDDSGTPVATDSGKSNGGKIVMDAGGKDASITLVDAGTLPPGQAIVINEVDYDQPLTDTAEFVELYNPTTTTADLSPLALVFYNGASNKSAEYLRVSLSGTLAPGAYYVVAPSGLTSPIPNKTFNLTSNNIQNGDPDGIALINTVTNVQVDSLSYGGIMAGLTEGSATTAKDSNTVAGSLIRSPNGADTNDNQADWKFTSKLTPGGANVLLP